MKVKIEEKILRTTNFSYKIEQKTLVKKVLSVVFIEIETGNID